MLNWLFKRNSTRIAAIESPIQFFNSAESFLYENEVLNREIILNYNKLVQQKSNHNNTTKQFVGYRQGAITCVAVSLANNVYHFANSSNESMNQLARHFKSTHTVVSGVKGPQEPTEIFAANYCKKFHRKIELRSRQNVYQAHTIKTIDGNGVFKKCESEDFLVLAQYMAEFGNESIRPPIPRTTESQIPRAKSVIHSGMAFCLYDKKEIVSVVHTSFDTRNTTTLAGLYTPVPFRSRGYGTEIMAKATKMVLETKKTCVLTADAHYPISNKLFKSLGYEKLNELVSLELPKAT